MTQQVVLVVGTGALPFQFDPLTGFGVDSLTRFLEPPEERRQWHVQRIGECLQSGQRGRRVSILDLGQHADGQSCCLGKSCNSYFLLEAERADFAPNRNFQNLLTRFANAMGILHKLRRGHIEFQF
jgi:hypothetical protein